MVRETRHLWVGNLPETVREDRIREHFKRSSDDHSPSGFERNNYYERGSNTNAVVRSSVIGGGVGGIGGSLLGTSLGGGISASGGGGAGSGSEQESASYIRRPNNYHASGDLRGRTRDRLYRNVPYSSSIVDRTNQVGHHRVTQSNTWYDSTTSTATSRIIYGNVASAVVTPDSGYDVGLERRNSNTDDIVSIKKSNKKLSKKLLLRSGSETPPSCGGESGGESSRSHSRSPSSCSSTNSTTSNSNESGSPGSSSEVISRSRNLQSAVSAPTPNTSNPNPVVHSEDNRPLAICVRNLPARSSDTSLKDGLFHEYKKHGKVTWVKVVGQSTDRYALVCFKKPDDVDKALEVSHDKLFFGCKIDVEPYQGYDVDDNEFRPYEAELDEYHPKSTRTLFIGNLEKDINSADLRKHFECFGEIIDIDIKKQGVTAYAFCQYSDIISVVKAMRKMDGEHLGNNRIKLGFGKSMPTNCVWIDGISDSVSENYLTTQFNRFGPVSQVAIDRDRKLALVFFEQIQYAQTAVKEMRGITLRGRKLQVDFASRECQETFYDKLEKPVIGSDRERSAIVFDTVREVSTRGFETTVSVPGARYSRYDTPSRSRTSSFSRHSNISSSGAASPSNSGGNTPRGTARARSVRYQSDYYENAGLEFSGSDRRYKTYDEYSQGSAASHEDVYDHEPVIYHKERVVESPPPAGAVAVLSSRVNILEPEAIGPTITRRRSDKSPGDIRHLQKERSHLLEQLEECPSSSGDELLFSPKKRIKFECVNNLNRHLTVPSPSIQQCGIVGGVVGSGLGYMSSSAIQGSSGGVIDTINVQNSVVNQINSNSNINININNNNNNNSDSICDSSSSSNLQINHTSIEPSNSSLQHHNHRKSVEIRRLSECSGQKYSSNSSNSNNNRRPSTDNLLISRRCDEHNSSIMNVYQSTSSTSVQSHHAICKRRKTSGALENEYHHSSRGRGHQLHSHHSHEASGGESADGSRPGTPLCDERPENIIPTEPRRIPTSRDRMHNSEPLSLPLPRFAAQVFHQNRLFSGASSMLTSSSHHGSSSSLNEQKMALSQQQQQQQQQQQHQQHQQMQQQQNSHTSLNSLTLSSPPPHHNPHHHHHHHHHHHSNQSSPKVLPPLTIQPSPSIEQPPASPSRAPSLSSNSSDSEIAPTGSPSMEERIKALDEMFEKWSGGNSGRTCGGGSSTSSIPGIVGVASTGSCSQENSASSSSIFLRHKLFSLDVNEVQPSDIVKSVLAKKSIFDDDLKRLENIGDKYEPRDFTNLPRSLSNFTAPVATPLATTPLTALSTISKVSAPLAAVVTATVPPALVFQSPSSMNQIHLQQRLGNTTASPLNSPQPISPYNSPSMSPNVGTTKSCVVGVTSAKGLQYPFPSHPPNTSSINSSIVSVLPTSSLTTTIANTAPTSSVATPSTTNISQQPSLQSRVTPECSATVKTAKAATITKSVSLSEKPASNVSTRVLSKSTSVPGSTNVGTIKVLGSSLSKDETTDDEYSSRNSSRRGSADLSSSSATTTTTKNSKYHHYKKDEKSNKSALTATMCDKDKLHAKTSEKQRECLDRRKDGGDDIDMRDIGKNEDSQESSSENSRNATDTKDSLQEKIDEEKRIADEKERKDKEKQERDRRKKEERERKEEEERERKEKEKEREEKERLEKERLEKERQEREMIERIEKERQEREKQERMECLEKERLEMERVKLEKESLEKERNENERLNAEKRERELRERQEKERLQQEQEELERQREANHQEQEGLNREECQNREREESDRHQQELDQQKEREKREQEDKEKREKQKREIEDNQAKENFYVSQDYVPFKERNHVGEEVPLKRHERNNSNGSTSGSLGSKRRMSGHDSIEGDDTKRVRLNNDHRKVIDRRDSRDPNRLPSERSSHKQHKSHRSSISSQKSTDKLEKMQQQNYSSKENDFDLFDDRPSRKELSCTMTTKDKLQPESSSCKAEKEQYKRHKEEKYNNILSSPEIERRKDRDRDHDSLENNFLESFEMRSSEEDEKQHQREKRKELKEHRKKYQQMLQNDNESDGGKTTSSQSNSLSERRRSETKSERKTSSSRNEDRENHKSSSDSSRKGSSKTRRLQSTDDSDSDGPKRQHSIFDIPDEGPTYISMYDKVKARSCKNMQKQEEEKKIKAKFTQLKQSRAKREGKKRSTSCYEDSDSDSDQENHRIIRHNHKSSNPLINSSSDDDMQHRSIRRIDFNSDESDEGHRIRRSQYHRDRINEICDGDTSDGSMIHHIKPRRKISSRKNSRSARIHSDTSDEETMSRTIKIKEEAPEHVEENDSKSDMKDDIVIKTEQIDQPMAIETTTTTTVTSVKSPYKIEKMKMVSSDDESGKQELIPPTEIKTEPRDDLFREVENKDPFDQLFSPESRRKHKKKQRRQKSLPPQIDLKEEKLDGNTGEIKIATPSPSSVTSGDFSELKKNTDTILNSERKRHTSKKEKRRERDYEKMKNKKSRKSKMTESYSFDNNESNYSIKRGEKMEDIFGPLSDEESDRSLNEASSNIPFTSSYNTDLNKTASALFDKLCNLRSDVKSPPPNTTMKTTDKVDIKTTPADEEFKAPPIENIEKERHKEESRKRKEKKRKEREKARVAMMNHVDENSVDLDEAGRALEAQLMEDCDSKSDELTAKVNTEHHQKVTDIDVFRFSCENDENSDIKSNFDKSRELSEYRIKEKKKKKKRSKEEKHQRREHHHHHSYNSSTTAATSSPNKDKSMDVTVEKIQNEITSPVSKQSPSLPCLLDDSPPRLLASNSPTVNKSSSASLATTATSPTTTTSVVPMLKLLDPPKRKPETFIPGYGGSDIDKDIHESAIKSIETELEKVDKKVESSKQLENDDTLNKLSKPDDKTEEKSRVVISQEETEDAVAALLGESFGQSSNADDYSDCYGNPQENAESSPPNPAETPVVLEEDAEETRKALESLNAEELDKKPDTPQSEHDGLQIDTDTEDQEDDSTIQLRFNNPPKTPDVDLSQIQRTLVPQTSGTTTTALTTVAAKTTIAVTTTRPTATIMATPQSEKIPVLVPTSVQSVITKSETQPPKLAITSPILKMTSQPQIIRPPTIVTAPRPQLIYTGGAPRTPGQTQFVQTSSQHSQKPRQFLMQPPTISIPEQHIIYQPINVMMSPRGSDSRLNSPRIQGPSQQQQPFQASDIIKRTNSPQSPNIIRTQNPRMSPQLSPVISSHSVVVQQRILSPPGHNQPPALLTTQSRIPLTPVLTPISKPVQSANILIQSSQHSPLPQSSSPIQQQTKLNVSSPTQQQPTIMRVVPTSPIGQQQPSKIITQIQTTPTISGKQKIILDPSKSQTGTVIEQTYINQQQQQQSNHQIRPQQIQLHQQYQQQQQIMQHHHQKILQQQQQQRQYAAVAAAHQQAIQNAHVQNVIHMKQQQGPIVRPSVPPPLQHQQYQQQQSNIAISQHQHQNMMQQQQHQKVTTMSQQTPASSSSSIIICQKEKLFSSPSPQPATIPVTVSTASSLGLPPPLIKEVRKAEVIVSQPQTAVPHQMQPPVPVVSKSVETITKENNVEETPTNPTIPVPTVQDKKENVSVIISDKPSTLPMTSKPLSDESQVAAKLLLTEENITKLSTNQPEESIEQDSKEDSDYWSAKEVNIESVIKKVDALCSDEGTSEECAEMKDEWSAENGSKKEAPPSAPKVLSAEVPTKKDMLQESKAMDNYDLVVPQQATTNDTEDFDEGVGDNVDKENTDKADVKRGSRVTRGKKGTATTTTVDISKNNNTKLLVSGTSTTISTSQDLSSGVQTRRGGKTINTSSKRGRGGRQNARTISGSSATSVERKPRSNNSESDVYEFNEDSGEELRPRLIVTIKSPATQVTPLHASANVAAASPPQQMLPQLPQQHTVTATEPPQLVQTVTQSTSLITQQTAAEPTLPTVPVVTPTTNATSASVPTSSQPHPNIQSPTPSTPKLSQIGSPSGVEISPAANTRKSRRLQERDGGSRNTVDDIIEDVVRNNMNQSPKSSSNNQMPQVTSPPSQASSAASGQTPPRRSTRQTNLIAKPPPLPPLSGTAEKSAPAMMPTLATDVRKSPRANRKGGPKDRKMSETSTDSSDEKPANRTEDKSMPDLNMDIVKVAEVKEQESKLTEAADDKLPTVIPSILTIPSTTAVPSTIAAPPLTTLGMYPLKRPEPSEPLALIDPVTGELTVMRQSKEGQYIPVPGTPQSKMMIQTAVTDAKGVLQHSTKPVLQQTTASIPVVTTTSSTQQQTITITSTSSITQSSTSTTAQSIVQQAPMLQQQHIHQQQHNVQQHNVQQPAVQQSQPAVQQPLVVHQSHVAPPLQVAQQQQQQQAVHHQQVVQQHQQVVHQQQHQIIVSQHQTISAQHQPIATKHQPITTQQQQPIVVQMPQGTIQSPTVPKPPTLKSHVLAKQAVVTTHNTQVKPNVVGSNKMMPSTVVPPSSQPCTVVMSPSNVTKSMQHQTTIIIPNQSQPKHQHQQQQMHQVQQQSQQQQQQQMKQIAANAIPHNLIVNIPQHINANSIAQATLSPRLKLQQSQPQIQHSMPQPMQQQQMSQQAIQHLNKANVTVNSQTLQQQPTQQQQHITQIVHQGPNQPQIIIHGSGKIPSPQLLYPQTTKIVHQGQTIQVTNRQPIEQIVMKQAPGPGMPHQIVKQVIPSVHHHMQVQQQQQQQQVITQQSIPPHIHPTGKVPQSMHITSQNAIQGGGTPQHIISTPSPAPAHQTSQPQQPTGTSVLQVKPAHQQQISTPTPPQSTKPIVVGRHQPPQILTGAVASPPLKQPHHQSVVTGMTSARATIPPISPQEQGRVHSLQGGLSVPNFEASLHGDIGGFGITRSQSPPPAHQQVSPITPGDVSYTPLRGMSRDQIMMFQMYQRAQEAIGGRSAFISRSPMLPGSAGEKPEMSEMEETMGASPPLELRRPASGPRTTVPHSLQSPQDRATDSPQVAQVYVHKSRIPHPQYPEASARYYEQTPSRVILTEPPPAHHRSQPCVVSFTQQTAPPAPGPPPSLTSHIHVQQQQQQHTASIIEKEREQQQQREREQQQLRNRERERTSIPGHANMPTHGSLVPAMPAPTTGRSLQVATPPHASQVPPQHDSLLMLLARYPVMWQGLLALKNDSAAVHMHFVFGNPQVATDSLPCNSDGTTPPLRIAQRMRLEQSQLDGVAKKMQIDNEHCMLLALPCGRDHMDVLQQSKNLQSGFITYLQQKQAAGIVNIAAPGSQQAAYVVHIFPSCEFANEHLARIAPDLLHRVAEIAHLLIVIATV